MSEKVLDESTALLEQFANRDYEHGWETDIESETIEPGLNEDTVRRISAKKNEPQWLLDWRLKAYKHFLTMKEPTWPNVHYKPVDLQSISYYSSPKKKPILDSLEDADPEILKTFQKLGIPVEEQKVLLNVKGAAVSAADARKATFEELEGKIAVDAVFDSVSVVTTFKKKLGELGIIFSSISEAVHEHPELVQKHLGSVVPYSDNYYATLNSAVFSDGSFVYIPKGTRCPMELSTYFRINAENTGQFERTLIICEEGGFVSYLEGCTAPMRDENQLHAAVVELIANGDKSTIKYSTVQNWYPGDPKTGVGGIYNFVTKRAICNGKASKVTWTQVETGSAITWKYPSVILKGDDSIGEFYSW
jgi:Fe-S cluster assembly protein SufB